MKSAQSHGSYLQRADQNELSDKITDTLNLEIIEPILRVYRAFRFARKVPHCQTHVLCVINTHDPNEKLGMYSILFCTKFTVSNVFELTTFPLFYTFKAYLVSKQD